MKRKKFNPVPVFLLATLACLPMGLTSGEGIRSSSIQPVCRESDTVIFSKIRSGVLVGGERLFILDPRVLYCFQKSAKNSDIFDQSVSIGRFGQGPGEFTQLLSIAASKNGDLYINEGRKIIQYNSGNSFIRNIHVSVYLHDNFFIAGDGSVIGVCRRQSEGTLFLEIVRLNPDGKYLNTLKSMPIREFRAYSNNDGGGVLGNVSHYYSTNLLFAPAGADKVFILENNSNNYIICNHSGQVTCRGSLEIKRETVDDDDMAEFEKHYGRRYVKEVLTFPEYRPLFSRALASPDGKVYVFVKPRVSFSREALSPENVYLIAAPDCSPGKTAPKLLSLKLKASAIFMGKDFYLYHAYNKETDSLEIFRGQLAIDGKK